MFKFYHQVGEQNLLHKLEATAAQFSGLTLHNFFVQWVYVWGNTLAFKWYLLFKLHLVNDHCHKKCIVFRKSQSTDDALLTFKNLHKLSKIKIFVWDSKITQVA